MHSESELETLTQGAQRLGLTLTREDAGRLLRLLDELARWNRTYNLTAITRREEMITHHLLDSLAVQDQLRGSEIADVGSGAGFPGLALALVNPQRNFTLIDSSNKKVRFMAHAARTLGLRNVTPLHSRVESMHPARPFDIVVARAFAPLPELLAKVATLCGPSTRVLAMKGKRPDDEIAAVPPGWRLIETRALEVPHLHEARHLVILEPRSQDDRVERT